MIQRYKNRYVLVESSMPINTADRAAESEIMRSIESEMGRIGHLQANPRIVHQVNDSVFIVRTNRGYERHAVLALAFIKSFGGRGAGFYTIRISGTIRSLMDFCRKTYAKTAENVRKR